MRLDTRAATVTATARERFRGSRTATNPAGNPAPLPTEWEGIPIIRTASIVNSEA